LTLRESISGRLLWISKRALAGTNLAEIVEGYVVFWTSVDAFARSGSTFTDGAT
jgi:hypothetical protein